MKLIVWDTGIGIAEDQQERIFDAFIQADSGLARHYDGIGLGLAYTQRVVNLLGGTCTVHSTPGEGSQFVIHLPIHPLEPQKNR